MSQQLQAIVVATKRLLENQESVREQLRDVISRLENVQPEVGAEARVESAFAVLASALDRRKGELLRSITPYYRRKCQEAICNANAVSDIQ